MKYINADRLRAEIERRVYDDYNTGEHEIDDIAQGALAGLIPFIDSLQQEPSEVDLEKEIEKYYYDNFAFISSAHTPTKDIVSDIATHFYERGQKNAANKFDEIEYNRQRAEGEILDKTLDEAAHSYSESDEPLYSPGHRFYWDNESLFGKQIETAFKAGAEWMAGQGVTLKVTDDTTWGEVNGFIHRNCDCAKEFQIRKKEESK